MLKPGEKRPHASFEKGGRGWVVAVLLLAVSLSGCASTAGTGGAFPPFTVARESAQKGWWHVRFQMFCSKEQPPVWHNDALIAHRIAGPVLARHRKEIPLWRFHRRAVPDATGHQFSFIFYSTPSAARKIHSEIQACALLDEMKSSGVILRDVYDDTSRITKPDIESVSDRNWSMPIQKSWPYFIMGVSESWLDLISQFAEDGRPQPLSFAGTQEFYREVNQAVEQAWVREGSHAYLHHLNAVFGYVPLNIRGKDPMRF